MVFGVLGPLQARAAVGDFAVADGEAAAVAELARRHERPLAVVFVAWYEALRAAELEGRAAGTVAYARAVGLLEGCGMPGLAAGLPALTRLSWPVREGRLPRPGDFAGLDWGPYAPWVRPLLLAGAGRAEEARDALDVAPRPPRDLLAEAMWCVLGRAALAVGDRRVMERAEAELSPARGELVGAGSGLISFGPVSGHLDALAAGLGRG